ncbi:MAG: Gfo/Idh/MocA family oxidoreductase [Acidobacteriaceae bacterium]|nr:Gfo/Idh/MocA family oxidoreductase [Acidobacteriaceae bacterium]MBV9780152.1 Gfo/Idh/MocA family oxidoreductase [Acidobacteriaceae bacterium]
MSIEELDRRDFLKRTGGIGAGAALASAAFSRPASRSSRVNPSRVIGANDRINIGLIGCGGRGSDDGESFTKYAQENNNACQIVAVCDVYEKRKRTEAEKYKCKGFGDYREVLALPEVDAVIVATPDHWHAHIALDAMDQGKDVYLEKPMCHTIKEIRQLVDTVRETKRVLQVGSQTTSADQWWKAKKAIADGMIGKMIMSQGSYHRNSIEGEWNWPIDQDAGPDASGDNHIDWKTWLGPAASRPYDADRFFRFRKYWDYSGGIATDLFFHVVAPLNICWDKPQYPSKVTASGGKYVFTNDREVPDTFHVLAEYPEGHSLVLSSSMANSQHIPGLIRGHEGTIIMVEHGMFERRTENITVRPELVRIEGQEGRHPFHDYKFGQDETKIPVEQTDMMQAHIGNFLQCMRSREKPHLDVETAAHAQVLITLSVEAYREGRVKYWDEKNWKSVDKPVKV